FRMSVEISGNRLSSKWITIPWPKRKIVQSKPKTLKRTTTSTQLKVRLISAAPSCVDANFISPASGNISKPFRTNNRIQRVQRIQRIQRGQRIQRRQRVSSTASAERQYAVTPTRRYAHWSGFSGVSGFRRLPQQNANTPIRRYAVTPTRRYAHWSGV